MTNSVPAPFKLSPVPAVGDYINQGGTTVTISSVSSADNGKGFIEYTLVLSNGVTIVATYANCVLESQAPLDVSGSQINPNTWKQTANA